MQYVERRIALGTCHSSIGTSRSNTDERGSITKMFIGALQVDHLILLVMNIFSLIGITISQIKWNDLLILWLIRKLTKEP